MIKKTQAVPTAEPAVCIVILNWNGLTDTLACLKSLSEITYQNYKVVVIDNGSVQNDASEIKKQFPQLELIRNEHNLGFTGGCNQGMSAALKMGMDYVVLLNNDTIVTKDFLGQMVGFYEKEPTAGMVSPLILYTDRRRVWFGGGKVVWGLIKHQHKGKPIDTVKLPEEPFKTDYVPGTALLISTKLIGEIGMLDEKYFAYYEDLDWCWRAQRQGKNAFVVPSAIIYHKKSGSTSEGGHRKFNKIPAFYMARNSLLLASNFKSISKAFFIFAQLFIKLPLTIILLVSPHAWLSYVHGTLIGLKMIARKDGVG